MPICQGTPFWKGSLLLEKGDEIRMSRAKVLGGCGSWKERRTSSSLSAVVKKVSDDPFEQAAYAYSDCGQGR